MLLAVKPIPLPRQVEDAVVMVQDHTYSWNGGAPINRKLIFWNPIKFGKKEYFGIIDWRYLPTKSHIKYDGEISDLEVGRHKLTFTDSISGVRRTVYFMHFIKTEGEPDFEYTNRFFIKEELRPGLSK